MHLRHLRFTICEASARTLHAGPTTDTAPARGNPGRISEVSHEDKTLDKKGYPGIPNTDKAPTELDIYSNSSVTGLE